MSHGDFGFRNLSFTADPLQLLDSFHDLIKAGCPDRVAAGFQSAPGRDRDPSREADLTLFGKLRTPAAAAKSAGLQGKGADDGESVMGFKDINVFRSDACHGIGLFCGAFRGAQP